MRTPWNEERLSVMKMLLAFDGFLYSRPALEEAAKIAVEEDTRVTVFSVVPPDARGSKSGGHVGLRPHAHEDVARAHAYLRERGIESTMRMEHGHPVSEILRVAEEGEYDLILAGSRGRGPIGELVLGSVSKALVHRAPCAVLVVAKDAKAQFEPAARA